MYILIFKSLGSDIEAFKVFMKNMPEVMKKAFNIFIDNLSTLVGFYSFVFSFVVLFGAIQAMNLGTSIVSKEIREKSADFLMTKPVSRVKILTSKLFSSLTILIVTNAVYTAVTASLVGGMSEGSFEAGKFALLNLSLFFTQVIFFSIGLIVSIAAKKIKSVLPVSLGLVFIFFAISAFAVTSSDDKLRFITPFQYFKTDHILAEGRYEPVYVGIGLLVIAAGIAISYVLFKRKDIHAV
jgi:ABC-2 type transport system permease protein